ncbi:MAG: hypothetical protein DMG12_12445, partial [Acidobacteria bacterium]
RLSSRVQRRFSAQSARLPPTLEKLNRLLSTIDDIFGNSPPDVRDIRLLRALMRIIDGRDSRLVAREFRLKGQDLGDLAQKVQQDDLPALLPYDELASPTELNRRRLGIGKSCWAFWRRNDSKN